jgi:hypothetical protein
MTQEAGNTDTTAQIRASNLLIRAIQAALKGRGLIVRERTNDVVIRHPDHPERGRVYIKLPCGDVSHGRTVWNYLGHWEGHGTDHDPDDDPQVDADLIIKTLTRPDAGSDTQ